MSIKLEAGKRYITRQGDTTGVMRFDPTEGDNYDWTDGVDSWTEDGVFDEYFPYPLPYDIVAEYKE